MPMLSYSSAVGILCLGLRCSNAIILLHPLWGISLLQTTFLVFTHCVRVSRLWAGGNISSVCGSVSKHTAHANTGKHNYTPSNIQRAGFISIPTFSLILLMYSLCYETSYVCVYINDYIYLVYCVYDSK